LTSIHFRHFKGGLYKLVGVGRLASDPAKTMVVYQNESTSELWIRDSNEFHEGVQWPDGTNAPRFRIVKDSGES